MNVCIVLSICFLTANDMPDYKKKYPSNRRKCEETAIMSHLPCRKVTIWVILYTLTISIIICSTAHVFPSLYSMEFLFLSSYMFLFRCSGLKRITSFSSFFLLLQVSFRGTSPVISEFISSACVEWDTCLTVRRSTLHHPSLCQGMNTLFCCTTHTHTHTRTHTCAFYSKLIYTKQSSVLGSRGIGGITCLRMALRVQIKLNMHHVNDYTVKAPDKHAGMEC